MSGSTHPASRQSRGPKILMFGPDLGVRGGVSSVENLLLSVSMDRVRVEHVPTMVEHAAIARFKVFAGAITTLLSDENRGAILHIHFASKGSTLRKLMLAALGYARGHKVILHAHGAAFKEFYGSLPQLVQIWVARTIRRADILIVLSSQWRDFYVGTIGADPSSVRVMHNPVVIPGKARQPSGTATTFLFLGRLGERKGIYDLLRAFADASQRVGGLLKLNAAGDGDVEGVRALASELGLSRQVNVYAWLDPAERDRLLAESDVFVLPSYNEGLPMAMLEAMASGLAVIATPVGGIPDVIEHEQTGLLVAPGNHEELVTAIVRLASDRALNIRLAESAREAVRAHDLVAYAAQLEDIYLELHDGSSGASAR